MIIIIKKKIIDDSEKRKIQKNSDKIDLLND